MIMSSNIQAPLFLPPLSSQADQATRGLVSLNLDEIFGDCFFTPDGDTVFLSEAADPDAIMPSGESHPAPVASRPIPSQQETFVPYSQGGGITTTGLHNPNAPATVMGRPAETSVNAANISAQYMVQPPQQRHHLQFATPAYPVPKRKNMSLSAAARERRMSDQQKSERRYDFNLMICFACIAIMDFVTYTFASSPLLHSSQRT